MMCLFIRPNFFWMWIFNHFKNDEINRSGYLFLSREFFSSWRARWKSSWSFDHVGQSVGRPFLVPRKRSCGPSCWAQRWLGCWVCTCRFRRRLGRHLPRCRSRFLRSKTRQSLNLLLLQEVSPFLRRIAVRIFRRWSNQRFARNGF